MCSVHEHSLNIGLEHVVLIITVINLAFHFVELSFFFLFLLLFHMKLKLHLYIFECVFE
jgi:hypothetical protein